jgi:hypothetical protein
MTGRRLASVVGFKPCRRCRSRGLNVGQTTFCRSCEGFWLFKLSCDVLLWDVVNEENQRLNPMSSRDRRTQSWEMRAVKSIGKAVEKTSQDKPRR